MLVEVGKSTPLLIVFDEFQSIANVDGATAVLRTELQHHYTTIGLLFAGSAPSAMRDIFIRHDQPFFNHADLLPVPALGLPAVHRIINDGFDATGRDPAGVASCIHLLTRGHPQRTMRAADMAWRRTDPGGDAERRWGAALIALRAAERAELSPGGATHARDRLLDDGKLHTDASGELIITDPLLADWLREHLPL
jgi:hypothetical protein